MTKRSLELIIGGLNNAQVRYMVVGGIAVVAHGYVRSTQDVDLMIQLEAPNLLTGLRVLERLGYRPTIPIRWEDFADATLRQSWIEQKQMKVLKLFSDAHRETSIDIFVYDPLGFDDAYSRRELFPLADDVAAPVCGYGDLIKLKLLAGRPRDIDDLDRLRKARGEA
jgi:hypothetical protein